MRRPATDAVPAKSSVPFTIGRSLCRRADPSGSVRITRLGKLSGVSIRVVISAAQKINLSVYGIAAMTPYRLLGRELRQNLFLWDFGSWVIKIIWNVILDRNVPRKPRLVGHNMNDNALPGSPALRTGTSLLEFQYLFSPSTPS